MTFEPESVTFIRCSISHGYGGCGWVMLWSADLPGDQKYTVGLIPKDTADDLPDDPCISVSVVSGSLL